MKLVSASDARSSSNGCVGLASASKLLTSRHPGLAARNSRVARHGPLCSALSKTTTGELEIVVAVNQHEVRRNAMPIGLDKELHGVYRVVVGYRLDLMPPAADDGGTAVGTCGSVV